MTTAQELAAHYGLATADTLPPRPKYETSPALGRLELTSRQRAIFDEMRPVALCVVASAGPVSAQLQDPLSGRITRRFGGNRGCWPLRLARTTSPSDTVTSNWNKDPFSEFGVVVRLWLRTGEHYKRLAVQVQGLVEHLSDEAMGEPLLNGWLDMGPDLHLPTLEGEILSRAERLRFSARTDRELVAWLEQIRREEDLLEGVGG
ncbi:hypothetical protein SAMN04488061_2853 [Filomicrobium insigne]|uniref:Uncharacterized protein n=1 Tax=Filomicrobium insigne TaxID=418854 RepID=A0A1H0SEE2_9HYPH|nr:hypothetical protein [Filomicrobium insigne]SDP39879.1 hypothetical protein SAMN04488061_2853 [Filomicrobium insigne]